MTPELTALLRAIRPPVGEQTPPSLPADLDWPLLRRLAVTYEVFPLVNHYLKTMDPQQSLLSPQEQGQWRKQAQVYAMQSLVVARQLLSIGALLNKHDIKIIPFKGPVLARQAYGDVALRQFTDLDFFVSPRDYLQVYHILEEAGFKPPDRRMETMVGYWGKLGRDLLVRNARIVLDVHPRLIQGPRLFSIPPEMWDRSVPIELLDRTIKCLSPEDNLIALALHGARNNWTSLKSLTDMAHLITSRQQWDRAYIARMCSHFGGRRILDTALGIIGKIFEIPIPLEISSQPVFGASFNALAADNKDDDDHAAILSVMWRSLDTYSQKIRYLCYFLFTPTPEDVRLLKIPPSLGFVYRLTRPLRLALKFLKRILPSLPHVQKKRMS